MIIDDLNKELSEDPRFDYESVVHKKEAYFNQSRDDIYDSNQKARKMLNMIIKNG